MNQKRAPTIREAWLEPLLKLIPYALAHPEGRRFPVGFRIAGRGRGHGNLMALRTAIRAVENQYPGLFLREDHDEIDKLYEED